MYILKESDVVIGTAQHCPKDSNGVDLTGWEKAASKTEYDTALAEFTDANHDRFK